MIIHIIEDTHARAAFDAVEKSGHQLLKGRAGSDTLDDFIEWNLKHLLKEKEVGSEVGVLTDLYFPAKSDNTGSHGELAPLGLIVMVECRRLGIPCVIVTAGYHHGKKYNQACFAGRVMGWPEIVDSEDYNNAEGEAPEKNWKRAIERLEALVAKTGAG